MELLKKSAETYKKYVNCNCIFKLDCELYIKVEIRAKYFHHLVGLQYLKDIAQVNPKLPHNSATDIYKKALKGKILDESIQKSEFYNKIHNRLLHFLDFDEVIHSKLIVDFDYTKLSKTSLLSRYLLYKEYEDGYAILGLKYDSKNDVYIPETFIFESTDYYIKDQISYNVVDVILEHKKK